MSEASTSNQQLEQQLSQLSQLERLLVQEKEVLQNRDPDAVLEISKQKNTLLADIQTLDQAIATSPLFAEQKSTGALDAQLSEIEACLSRCKTLNDINGQIIAHSQMAIDRITSSLLDNRGKASMTYNSKGKKHVGLSSLGIKA